MQHVSPTLCRGQWCILVTSLNINLGCHKETTHNCDCNKVLGLPQDLRLVEHAQSLYEVSRSHPNQMPQPPQVAPFDVEEQQIYSEYSSEPSHRRKLISPTCAWDVVLSGSAQLVTTGEGRNVDQLLLPHNRFNRTSNKNPFYCCKNVSTKQALIRTWFEDTRHLYADDLDMRTVALDP